MVLMKISIAIILTKLQRFESRERIKKTNYAAGPEISMPKQTLEARLGKFDVIFEVWVGFDPQNM